MVVSPADQSFVLSQPVLARGGVRLYSPTVLLRPCGNWCIDNQAAVTSAKGIRNLASVLEQLKEVNETL